MTEVTPSLVLRAYSLGIFPMAESKDASTVYWVDPEQRGILPIERFHIPRRLKRTVRQNRFNVTCDTDFDSVINACAESNVGRQDTWINDEVRRLFKALNHLSLIHI